MLVQLLFEARPPERGLDDYEGEAGGKSWVFPQNYPDRINPVISNLKTRAAQEDADVNPIEQDP